jgi:glutamine---fructose-6-phosphate transaminase (isomerizing)
LFDATKTGPTQPADGRNSPQISSAGGHSLTEILSQPQCWNDILARIGKKEVSPEFRHRFGNASGWLFIGCGSSYYVAMAAAATSVSLTGRPAQAIPASELLLFPETTLAAANGLVPVLISRSGRTSEVLKAGQLLKSRGVPALAITCALEQPLEEIATATICLPDADEQSTVMTRSFSSMLLGLQELAADVAGDSDFRSFLRRMPPSAAMILRTLPEKISNFTSAHRFSDHVCLGQGPFFGLACEYALKVTEMSLSYAQSFHTLEFRHGPKSIVGPEALLVFLLSESGYAAEREVLEEMKSLGAVTLVVTNEGDARARAASDLLVELSLDVPELARLAPTLFAGQLLGLYTGLHKGLDPDSPRNLTRVVTLDEEPPQAS